MPTLRNLIPLGYTVAGSTHAMSARDVGSYNATQERINAFIIEGLTVPEYELMASFTMINSYLRGER